MSEKTEDHFTATVRIASVVYKDVPPPVGLGSRPTGKKDRIVTETASLTIRESSMESLITKTKAHIDLVGD